jgi:hypothetical protein
MEYVEDRRKTGKPLFYDPDRSRGGNAGKPTSILVDYTSVKVEALCAFFFLQSGDTRGKGATENVGQIVHPC